MRRLPSALGSKQCAAIVSSVPAWSLRHVTVPPSPPEPPKAAPPPPPPPPPKAAPPAPNAAPPQPPKAPPPPPPTAPKAAPVAPAAPTAAPGPPAVPSSPKAAPEAPKVVPQTPPEPPKAPTPQAPPPPPTPPPQATPQPPAAPEAPKAAPTTPKTPPKEDAPVTPKVAPPPPPPPPPKAAPHAPPAPKAAPPPPPSPPAAPKAAAQRSEPHTPSPAKAKAEPSTPRQQKPKKQPSPKTEARVPAAAPPPLPPRAPPAPPAPPAPEPRRRQPHPLYDIAPPHRAAAASKLPKSMSRAVEEAIEDAERTRILRPFQPPQEEAAVKAQPAAEEEPIVVAEPMDFSARQDRLKPLPADIEESLDRHEVPVALGGEQAEAEAVPPSTPEPTAAAPDTATPAQEQASAEKVKVEQKAAPAAGATAATKANTVTAVVCQPPVPVWQEELRPYVDNSASCVKVIAERGVRRLADKIVIQLVETPSTAMSAVRALSTALDRVGELVAKSKPAAAATKASEEASAATGAADAVYTVELRTAPSCDFFVAEQSPLELGLGERIAYQQAKEVVLARLRHPSPRTHFVAFAQNKVTDFGAEVLFACGRRYLVADPTVEDSATAAAPEPVVGFPSLAMGVLPAVSTVHFALGLHGAQFTLEMLPQLHQCDAFSLKSAGLLDAVLDLTGKEFKDADDEGTAAGSRSSNNGSGSGSTAGQSWSAWLEGLLLHKVCPTPEWRERLLLHMILSQGLCEKLQGAPPQHYMMSKWYEYAWQALTQVDTEKLMLKCEHITETLVRSEANQGQARHVRYLRHIRRRSLAPLVNTSFVSLKESEKGQWHDKLQRLASSSSSSSSLSSSSAAAAATYEGTLLLDCSARCIESTLQFAETHFTKAMVESPNLHFVLLGSEDNAATLLNRLPCAALVSSISPVLDLADANRTSSLQTVRVYSREGWPADLSEDTLLAAVTYLQHRDVPYVVSSEHIAQRLVAALCREVFAIASGSAAAADVEEAATRHLHFRYGPFRLMDLYGTRAMLLMLAGTHASHAAAAAAAAADAQTMDRDAVALDGLERMLQDGLSGQRRHGFYASAESSEVQQGVVDQYFRAALPSIADRLLAVLVNECCALLAEGVVLTADDVNAVSVTALVMEESSGGVLGMIDCRPGGVADFTRTMDTLAARYGSHLAPHPLLRRMAAGKQAFANLSKEAAKPQSSA